MSDRAPAISPGLVMAFVIVCWGLGPPVSKLITAPAVIAVLYRFWISVALLAVVAVVRRRPLRVSTMRAAALAGAAFGINLVFVFLALGAVEVAVLSVITTMQPGFILLVAGPFLGERPRLRDVVLTAVGIGGTALVVLGAGGGLTGSWRGVAFAVAAMVTFTLYFLLTKRARSAASVDDMDPVEWMTAITLFAALTVTPWALLVSDGADYRAVGGSDWLWLAFIVVVTGIIGHVAMAWTHRYIEASRSSLYLLSMNVVAVGAAWPIHDEPLTLLQLIGGVIVVVAVAAVVRRPATRPGEGEPAVRRFRRRSARP